MTTGINPHRPAGGGSLSAAVSAAVAGGQVVSADQTVSALTAGGLPTVTVASTGAENVIGVATTDAAPAGTDSATDASARPEIVTVVHDMEVEVTFQTAQKLGDTLKVGAAGTVMKFVEGTDHPGACIGQCRSQSVAAGAKGWAFIHGSGG